MHTPTRHRFVLMVVAALSLPLPASATEPSFAEGSSLFERRYSRCPAHSYRAGMIYASQHLDHIIRATVPAHQPDASTDLQPPAAGVDENEVMTTAIASYQIGLTVASASLASSYRSGLYHKVHEAPRARPMPGTAIAITATPVRHETSTAESLATPISARFGHRYCASPAQSYRRGLIDQVLSARTTARKSLATPQRVAPGPLAVTPTSYRVGLKLSRRRAAAVSGRLGGLDDSIIRIPPIVSAKQVVFTATTPISYRVGLRLARRCARQPVAAFSTARGGGVVPQLAATAAVVSHSTRRRIAVTTTASYRFGCAYTTAPADSIRAGLLSTLADSISAMANAVDPSSIGSATTSPPGIVSYRVGLRMAPRLHKQAVTTAGVIFVDSLSVVGLGGGSWDGYNRSGGANDIPTAPNSGCDATAATLNQSAYVSAAIANSESVPELPIHGQGGAESMAYVKPAMSIKRPGLSLRRLTQLIGLSDV